MRFWKWVKAEFFHILPVFLFFFISFYLINMTDGLMEKKEGIEPFPFLQVLLAALIIAKIFLILDHLPFINAFSEKPLIFKVVWKTALYFFATILFRFFELWIPDYWHLKSFHWQIFSDLVNWPRFWAVQIWILVLLAHFVTSRELRKVIGVQKIRRIFLGF